MPALRANLKSRPHSPHKYHNFSIPVLDEISNDIPLIDSHDWRDLYQLISRPDPYEERDFAPLSQDRL